MKIERALNMLGQKYGMMDATESSVLYADSQRWFQEKEADLRAKEKSIEDALAVNRQGEGKKEFKPVAVPKLTLAERFIKLQQHWAIRYVILGLYIWAVPTIRRFMDGEGSESPENEMVEFMNMYNAYKQSKQH